MNKKNKEEKRNLRIVSYLTEDEMEYFKALMELHELSQTEMIRWSLFNKEIKFDISAAEKNEDRKQIIYELSKIGNNLNQIAHHLNGGGEMTANTLSAISKNLKLLQLTMTKIYKEDDKKENRVRTKLG